MGLVQNQSKEWQIQTVTECNQGLCSLPKLNTAKPAYSQFSGYKLCRAEHCQGGHCGHGFVPPFHSSWGNRGKESASQYPCPAEDGKSGLGHEETSGGSCPSLLGVGWEAWDLPRLREREYLWLSHSRQTRLA